MGESVSGDTAGACALLSVVTEDDWLGFSKTVSIFLCIDGHIVMSICSLILGVCRQLTVVPITGFQ